MFISKLKSSVHIMRGYGMLIKDNTENRIMNYEKFEEKVIRRTLKHVGTY